MARVVKRKTLSGAMAAYGIIKNPIEDLDASTKQYIRSEVDKKVKDYPQLKIQIVEQLPDVGENLILYLIKDEEDYLEYIWDSEHVSFELIGNQKPDLSIYADKEWFKNEINIYF